MRYLVERDFFDLFWCCMTLTLDLLIPKVDQFMALLHRSLHLNWFVHFQNIVFTGWVTAGMSRRTDERWKDN